MKLYNTLTATIDDIKPVHSPTVTVYTCGPTVYDYPHVGNWFTFIRYDLLIRTLRAAGLQPKWVMNITDVGHLASDADEGEDKLIKGARREGKTAWDVAAFYADYFEKGLERLNIQRPDELPRATDHIPEQIELIRVLEAKGYTYRIDDGIYYDTAKFPSYAAFGRLDLDELQAGARVEHNTQKRNLSDFALWKFSPADMQRDMEWDSPWGKGFPGWHIECSAMSMKYLGETLDIHSGGIDHIPVHHTNEIAQSEAVTGKPFALHWMHTNHVTVNGEKISKSLGNGITLEDIEAKGYDLMVFRLHVLESHYRSQSKFSWEALEAAQNHLRDLRALAVLRYQPTERSHAGTAWNFEAHIQNVRTAMEHDLRTPEVFGMDLAGIQEVGNSEDLGNTEIHIDMMGGIPEEEITNFTQYIQILDDYLGLGLMDLPDITEAQRKLVREREAARQAKDWAISDHIRRELEKQGIGLRDMPQKSLWYYL